MKTIPVVTIDLEEYNRLVQVDNFATADMPKSVIQFRKLVHSLASRIECIPPEMNYFTIREIANHLREAVKSDELIRNILNEKA